MGLEAARHLTLTTGAMGIGLTLSDIEEFVSKALAMGIPTDARVDGAGSDVLRRVPVEFSIHWTEAL